MHNGVSCPNRTDKQLEQCPTTMFMQSHLSDSGRAIRECSPINENMIDHNLCKTRKSLNECESAIRKKYVHDRNSSNEHLVSYGYNLSQGVSAHIETGEQACTLDNCQAIYTSTGTASSSSGCGRTNIPVQTDGVKLATLIHAAPGTINQAKTVSSETQIIQYSSSGINHTQEDLNNFLQGRTSSVFPVYAGGSLDDVLDVMEKNCQPLNRQSQNQNDHLSASTSYPVRDSSSRLEEQYRYTNRRRRNIKEHQSCIKSRTLPSKAKINAQTEEAVAEKSHAGSEMKGIDIVNVVMKKVAILKLDDMSK